DLFDGDVQLLCLISLTHPVDLGKVHDLDSVAIQDDRVFVLKQFLKPSVNVGLRILLISAEKGPSLEVSEDPILLLTVVSANPYRLRGVGEDVAPDEGQVWQWLAPESLRSGLGDLLLECLWNVKEGWRGRKPPGPRSGEVG